MKTITRSRCGISVLMALLLSVIISFSASAQTSQPTIDQSFTPDTIPVENNISKLTFEMDHLLAGTSISFTSNLAPGLTIANPSNAQVDCNIGDGRDDGIFIALAGSSQIIFQKDVLVGVEGEPLCRASVDVTSAGVGTYINPAVTLNYTGGTDVSDTATLTVVGTSVDRPLFSKSFSPVDIEFGGRSTLSFNIDNSGGGNYNSMIFSDNFPMGMLVAEPANVVFTDCPSGAAAAFTAVPGSNVITYNQFNVLFAGLNCVIQLDVIVNASGLVQNVSEELFTTSGNATLSSGQAVANVTVNTGKLELTKEFTNDPINAGGVVNLLFTIQNTDRINAATGIEFTDNLNLVLAGLTAISVNNNDCIGSIDLTGGNVSFSGGSLSPESSCMFDVSVQVPAGAPSNEYLNETSFVTGVIDGESVTGDTATDSLFVSPIPLLTKSFDQETVQKGDTINMDFTITNTSALFGATDIEFVDDLTAFLPFPVELLPIPTVFGVVLADPCGTGSSLTVISLGTERQGISLNGGNLGSSGTCSFSLGLVLPDDMSSGIYENTTDQITALVDGDTVTGPPASDTFAIVGPPVLSKEFIDDPVKAGTSVTLEFTLTYSENAPGDATAINFTDNLDAVITGMTAVGLPLPDVCGAGSLLSGTATLSLTGGSLIPGESCSFAVEVSVPAGTPSGAYTNTTSALTADVLQQTLVGPVASADLLVGGLKLSKLFDPDLALPGSSVDITYTIASMSDLPATGIVMQDDLGNTLFGLNVSPTVVFPMTDVCGPGSELDLISTDVLQLIGGSLDSLGSCSFTVSLDIPPGTAADTYLSETSQFVYEIDTIQTTGEPASAQLTVTTDVLVLSKEFLSNVICPGESTKLRFTMTNLTTELVDSIGFSDDLDAALNDMVATGLPLAVCGGDVGTVDGGKTIDFTGGLLDAEDSCSFEVDVLVYEFTPLGSLAFNQTSEITGLSNGIEVNGPTAADDMQVNCVELSKAFDPDSIEPGAVVQLSFTMSNTSTTESVSPLSFSDDLDAMLAGAEAIGLPMNDGCGTGSVVDGADLVTVENVTLLPDSSCAITIDVRIPATAAEGIYENISSELFWDDLAADDPATAELTVLPAPPEDVDEDGVLDTVDVCLDTVIPEGVPTIRLNPNNYALMDGDTIFEVGASKGKSKKLPVVFTIQDTAGCSCEQIIEAAELGSGHTKYGCSLGTMRDWVDLVNP